MSMFNKDIDFETYWRDEKTSTVKVRGNDVSFINYTNDPLKLPFGVKQSVERWEVEDYFEDRCFPRERANCNDILGELGLSCYEPELICRKTWGRQFDDFCWIKFLDEPKVTYEDIRLR